MVAAGLEEGSLLARQDVLRGVRWTLPRDDADDEIERGVHARRSNYRRNVFDPAATAAGWPRRPDGRWVWTFHSLRHVFATWDLSQRGARIEDVSRLTGRSSVRITQDIYVSPDGDLFKGFFEPTK